MVRTIYGFQRDGTVQLFGTKGQKFLHRPGQRDDGTSSKTCQGTGGDMGRDNHHFSVKIRMGQGQDGTITIFLF